MCFKADQLLAVTSLQEPCHQELAGRAASATRHSVINIHYPTIYHHLIGSEFAGIISADLCPQQTKAIIPPNYGQLVAVLRIINIQQ